MTSKQKQKALIHAGTIMTAEAIHDLDDEEDYDEKEMSLLCDLRSLFYIINIKENVMWTEGITNDGDYWCELSILHCLYDDRNSMVSISFDGKENEDHMLGTVRLAVDGREVLNGIRYVEL